MNGQRMKNDHTEVGDDNENDIKNDDNNFPNFQIFNLTNILLIN